MSTERAYPVFRPMEPLPLSDASVDELLASLPDLDETAQLAREYAACVYNLGFVLTSIDLAQEAVARLDQLSFLLKSAKVQDIVHIHLVDWWPGEVDESGTKSIDDPVFLYRWSYARFLTDLCTEAFYYFAHRLQTMLENHEGLMPFIDGYRPARGVLMVRNQLLEHPEKTSRVFNRAGSSGGHAGPAIKGSRFVYEPQEPQDPGLYMNAAELKEKVDRAYRDAIEALDRFGRRPQAGSADLGQG
jgi:hypothetical protein